MHEYQDNYYCGSDGEKPVAGFVWPSVLFCS